MQELTYKLELFEGPLELLLSLINKNKMDINDILHMKKLDICIYPGYLNV